MRPSFPRWSDLCPPRTSRPLSAVEVREHHAIRLGLVLALGVIQNGGFVRALQPLPMDYDQQWAWLRRALKPLARHSPAITQARRLIDLDGRIAWDNPRTLKRHLLRLVDEAERLGQTMRQTKRQGQAKRQSRGS